MKPLYSVVLLCTQLGFGKAFAQNVPALTPDTDWVQDVIRSNQVHSVDELLQYFPRDWLKSYAIFYSSRSQQGASMARPRVVSGRLNRNFMFAFREASPSDSVETMEIIETHGVINPAQFAEIRFNRSGEGSPQVDRNPQRCLNCHGFRMASGDNTGEGGFIWDHYPQTIGAFGSAHNGYLYSDNPPTGGTSRIPTPEFEVRELEYFKRDAGSRPLYRHLQSLEEQTYDSFASEHFNFYADFQAFHILRFWEKYFETNPSFASIRSAFLSAWLENTDPLVRDSEFDRLIQSNIEPYYQKLENECMQMMQADLERLRTVYTLYGTENDLNQMSTFILMLSREGGYPSELRGLKSFCTMGRQSIGGGDDYSPVRDGLIHFLFSGSNYSPQVSIATDLFKTNAYITSGGYPLKLLSPDIVEAILRGSTYTGTGYNPEAPTSSELVSLAVPSFYRRFRFDEISTTDKLVEISSRLETALVTDLREVGDSRAREYFNREIFPGFSENFWNQIENLH